MQATEATLYVYIIISRLSAYTCTLTRDTHYSYIHTRIRIQRSTIFTYRSNPRGSPRIPMTLVILFTLNEPTKDSRKYREVARRVRASMVVQREILCHSHFDKFSFRLSSSVPFFTFPFVIHAFSPTIPSPLVVAPPRAEKRISKITQRDGPPNL